MLAKAYSVVFFSSFCLMVIELVAGRILAPYIGVSLYTWASIINIVDDFERGKFMVSFIYTLRQTFEYVYLFAPSEDWEDFRERGTFVIAATNRPIDFEGYKMFATDNGSVRAEGYPYNETELKKYLAVEKAVLLTDDYAPTDIFVAELSK